MKTTHTTFTQILYTSAPTVSNSMFANHLSCGNEPLLEKDMVVW